jgi:hypothetical protein
MKVKRRHIAILFYSLIHIHGGNPGTFGELAKLNVSALGSDVEKL